jgi:1-phosphofructokinase family hexose kinase
VTTAIVTLTLNPAIDQAISVEQVVMGGLNRCLVDSLDPGGKGVNASRVIARLGHETVALGLVGGVTGGMLRTRLDAEGVTHAFDEVDGLTRINVMVLERALTRRTRLYLPGPQVGPTALARIHERLAALESGTVVILGGSIPPGIGHDVYRELTRRLTARGVDVLVDASGAAFAAVLDARPALVKPNVEEAEELLGRPLRSDDEVLEAAREIRDRGPERVVISQGAEGAIGVDAVGAWKAVAPRVVARSTVGSGDSMMAGLAIALADGQGLVEGLRLGTAAGAATAMVPGTQLCAPDEVSRLLGEVAIRPLPPYVRSVARAVSPARP